MNLFYINDDNIKQFGNDELNKMYSIIMCSRIIYVLVV